MRKHALKQKVHNMTPNVSEEEAKAVRDKFDATYMKGGSGEIRDIPQEARQVYGAEGGLGLVGGILTRVVKTFANTGLQYLKGWNKQISKKSTKNTKPLIINNKVVDRMPKYLTGGPTNKSLGK